MNMKSNIIINKEEKKVIGFPRIDTTSGSLNDGHSQNRVVITKEANAALEEIVGRVSEGFNGGTVAKSDIANYVFLNLSKFFSEADIKCLRSIHFDEKKMLGAVLKNENDLPEDLKKVVRQFFGIAEKDKKKPNKTSFDLSTVQSVDKS